jgi:hypothetical protein
MLFNEVGRNYLVEEVFGSLDGTNQSFSQFAAFLNWLDIDHSRLQYRVAPSLMARSESAFFGLSAPRFAVRTTWDNMNEGGVICLRRGRVLNEQLTKQILRIQDIQNTKGVNYPPGYVPAEDCSVFTRIPTVIGDCFLPIPNGFEDFSVITTSLKDAYGEPSEPNVEGTPYVQHCWTSGLCGHAVAYIASVLLHEHVGKVYAMGDISVVLSRDTHDYTLVEGFQPWQLSKYFCDSSVGLAMLHQQVTTSSETGFTPESKQVAIARIATTLRSYIKSGMPVVLSMDQGMMNNIYSKKSPNKKSARVRSQGMRQPVITRDPHFVIAIGCSGSGDFLIHDSARLPYIPASSQELVAAFPKEKDASEEEDRHFVFPVTPDAVRMPLLATEEMDDNGYVSRLGLCDIAKAVTVLAELDWGYIPEGLFTTDEVTTTDFRLLRASNLSVFMEKLSEGVLSADAKKWANEIATKKGNNWIWIQRTDNGFLWAWDAEITPPLIRDDEKYDYAKYLIGGVDLIGVTLMPGASLLRTSENSTATTTITTSHFSRGESLRKEVLRQVDLSLITSFCTQSNADAFNNWPSGVNRAELYTFMRGDMLPLFGEHIDKSSKKTVVETLACVNRLRNRADVIRSAGESIIALADKKNVYIDSFASFIPELSASNPTSRSDGIDALCLLYDLASFISTASSNRHCIKIIEIVGGSRINFVVPIQPKLASVRDGMHRVAAYHIDVNQAIDNLQKTITHEEIQERYDKTGIRLAVELEPGRLFSFNTETSLDLLVDRLLSKNPSIGLNLDVGHWILADMKVSLVHDKYRNYIFSSHLSDNWKAHFGDTVLGRCNNLDHLRSWVAALKMLPQQTFTGKLNIEYEGARDPEALQKCVDVAIDLLK